MFTINIKGKSNPKDPKMVKLEMIIFKTGYARVNKVFNVLGSAKEWDNQALLVLIMHAHTKRSRAHCLDSRKRPIIALSLLTIPKRLTRGSCCLWIHSIKGETHAATLYIETSYRSKCESQRIAEQLKGIANYDDSEIHLQTLKMAYVGMSRPRYLLCMAISRSNFTFDCEELRRLWDIEDVVNDADWLV